MTTFVSKTKETRPKNGGSVWSGVGTTLTSDCYSEPAHNLGKLGRNNDGQIN